MSNKMWLIPLEPLEERYTASWYRNFPRCFEYQGYDVEVVEGEALTTSVKVGSFLDMNSTVNYKSSQMMKIAQAFQLGHVKDGDIFFIMDVEFWGIEVIRLMARMNNINVKMFGILHAGSYTVEDAFSVAADFQQYTEVGWIAAFDKVFVGSSYHKQAFVERRLKPLGAEELKHKIRVIPNPMFEEDYKCFNGKKKRQVIISNRFDYEKRPNISLDIAYLLKKKDSSINIIVTTGRKTLKSNQKWLEDKALGMQKDGIIKIHAGLTKEKYHRHLAQSTVMLSNSIEENFGYCIAEALHYGTIPVVQNGLSHNEMMMHTTNSIAFDLQKLMFNNIDQAIEIVHEILNLDTEGHYDLTTVARNISDKFFHEMEPFVKEMQRP